MQSPSSVVTPFDDLEPHAVLTAEEIAGRLRVTSRSVRRAISRGELPASRVCGLHVLAVDAAGWWRNRAVVGIVPERRRTAEPHPTTAASATITQIRRDMIDAHFGRYRHSDYAEAVRWLVDEGRIDRAGSVGIKDEEPLTFIVPVQQSFFGRRQTSVRDSRQSRLQCNRKAARCRAIESERS